jgi:hypothetical protein
MLLPPVSLLLHLKCQFLHATTALLPLLLPYMNMLLPPLHLPLSLHVVATPSLLLLLPRVLHMQSLPLLLPPLSIQLLRTL